MPNPDGTYTRAEHEAAIMGLYVKKVDAGMTPEDAMTAAGAEWRQKIKELGEAKIAYVKSALGIKD